MNTNRINRLLVCAVVASVSFTSCSKTETIIDTPTEEERWITIAGAMMQETPGDGNGGTMVYSMTIEEAKNPEYSVNVFDQGTHVKSNRTARLQASSDGGFLYNIQYTGADGGIFNKYQVLGGKQFTEIGSAVNTAPYVGTSPRWSKVNENVGIAVNVKDIVNIFDGEGAEATFKGMKGTGVILVLDLENPRIIGTEEFDLALSSQEQAQGYHIYRMDSPVLNKAGDKLLIGTWMRKFIPGTSLVDEGASRLSTKMIVVDYPSLGNPKVISTALATGDNSGYRSPMSHLSDDGQIYQATHRELAGSGGSRIVRINQNSEYDNAYDFSLDLALGITDSYIEMWRYVGDGIGFVIYSIDGQGGYVARVDLNARTAIKMDIPNDDVLDFGQYQSIAAHGDDVFIAVSGIGSDGQLYVFNRKTGAMSQGAKLLNKAGNRYIGVY